MLPGHQWSRAVTITEAGRILGIAGPADHPGMPVYWTPTGVVKPIPMPLPPGGMSHYPLDMNDRGQVVGWTYGDLGLDPWVWSRAAGFFNPISLIPGAGESYTNVINSEGLVLGNYSACNVACNFQAFLWHPLTGISFIGVPPGAPPETWLVAGAIK